MLRPLFTELSHFLSFSSIFLFLNDVFTLINLCSIFLVLKTRLVTLMEIMPILVKLKVNVQI